MRITVPTYVHVDKLIPPRCRKPRDGSIAIEVDCELAEISAAGVFVAAHVSTRECGEFREYDYYFEPSVGFLHQDQRNVEELVRGMGRRLERSDVAERDVPGQGQYEIARKRLEVAAEAAEFVVSDQGTVYRKVAEPCYCIEYSPSFNWSTCDLVAREAPLFTTPYFIHERGWNRFFSAMQLQEAERVKAALQRETDDRATGHEDRIDVFFAEAFTFDADRWHAEKDLHLAREKFDKLIRDLRLVPGGELQMFCHGELVLADWLREAGAILHRADAVERLVAQTRDRHAAWLREIEEENDGDVVPVV